MSGTGQLSANPELFIGYSGTGTFTQDGGTNSITYLSLGFNSGSSGTYNLSGTSQLSASNEQIGDAGTGTFTQTGGSNIVSGFILGTRSGSNGTYILSGTGQLSTSFERIGSSGMGSFTQTGGTNTISKSDCLYLGYNSGSSGTYNLSDTGQLSAGRRIYRPLRHGNIYADRRNKLTQRFHLVSLILATFRFQRHL